MDDCILMLYLNFTASLFSGQDTVFMVPLIVELSDYMVYLAFDVDMHYHFKSKAKKANIIARLLTRVFNIMLADRSPIGTSKRQGIFRVTNMAFKVYFKLNTTRLCQTFMSNIETGGVDLSLYPISDQVTYKYYLGRYALYDIRLQQAYDHLQFAFEHCGKDHWHNKRVILHYLIPAGIMMGYFPKKEYLIKYNLHNQYWPLIQALKKGDIASYLHHLYVYIDYFKGKYNVLLLRDRGIVLAWRCLVRRLYTIRKSTQATPFLTFNECVKAFNFAERTNRFTIPEIECMLVSLVSQGYIRGYLHHQKQRLVLSKVNPFPPISKVRLYREKYNESLMTEYMEKEYPPIPEEIQMLIEEEE
ncbi:hypothetical protein RMCBS344292_13636 [Rhizopus microsporus]|nr:hypothetical protein RMCBS344292_13636 [Rhizopus microsporus]